jgi:hypothetical protein
LGGEELGGGGISCLKNTNEKPASAGFFCLIRFQFAIFPYLCALKGK